MRERLRWFYLKCRACSVSTIALTAVAVLLLLSSGGLLLAKISADVGHDVEASHDRFDVAIDVKNSYSSEYQVTGPGEDGRIEITKSDGSSFSEGDRLPLAVDIYYTGESYAALRFQIAEQWTGAYRTTPDASGEEKSRILPEPILEVKLNEAIPLADCRLTDGFVYLAQYQTTLKETEADTNWPERNQKMLCTLAEEEPLYVEENGAFRQLGAGETAGDRSIWRKNAVIPEGGITVPRLSNDTDGVYQAKVEKLRLYIAAQGVQFNRIQAFWEIEELPKRTNEASGEVEGL